MPDNIAEKNLVVIAEDKTSLTARVNAALDDKNVNLAFSLCNTHLESNPDDAQAHRHLGLLHAAANTPGTAINSGKPDLATAFIDHD